MSLLLNLVLRDEFTIAKILDFKYMEKWLRKVQQELNIRDEENILDIIPIEHPEKIIQHRWTKSIGNFTIFTYDVGFQGNINTVGIII